MFLYVEIVVPLGPKKMSNLADVGLLRELSLTDGMNMFVVYAVKIGR